MGFWGTQLYEDDVALDVKDYYNEQLHKGRLSSEITKELIDMYSAIASDEPYDYKEAAVFWLSLADTQWNFGRLEDYVKEKALFCLNEGWDSLWWKNNCAEYYDERIKVLNKLHEKLLSPQPPVKRTVKRKLFECKWENGDVYAYKLKSELSKEYGFFDKYVFFIKVSSNVWHPGHVVPIVYFYNIISDKILSLSKLEQYDYMHQFYKPIAYKNNPSLKHQYLLELVITSNKTIQNSQLTYIGKINDIKRVKDEDTENCFCVAFKELDDYIIKNYLDWQ